MTRWAGKTSLKGGFADSNIWTKIPLTMQLKTDKGFDGKTYPDHSPTVDLQEHPCVPQQLEGMIEGD